MTVLNPYARQEADRLAGMPPKKERTKDNPFAAFAFNQQTATAVRVAEALKACTPAGSSASCSKCIAASNLKAAKAQKRRAYEKKRYREKGGREAQKRKRAVKKEKLEPKEEELLSQLTQETLSQEY
ncbi:hypothetical protein TeGR_g1976 [Tetraparma gracilis]|uniref:Uncharacterized protein n=1 Tax=Tetraparma gracilis TaxID=2962635 RepID=A0ABQ6N9B4_9STRA|nr:hypothetical protein TeGR_g1976 [Tetraparma gracilis]